MKRPDDGTFVRLTCDILQNGYCHKAGTIGMVTAFRNGRVEVMTGEYRYIDCSCRETTPMKLVEYEKAKEVLEAYCGHHCNTYDTVQFNVRFHDYHIPELVTRLCPEKAVWERYDEILSQHLEDFMDQNSGYRIGNIIPWLSGKAGTDWWQAGRSGGWLVVNCGTDCESAADDISFSLQQMSDLRELYDNAGPDEDNSDIVKEFKSLAKSTRSLKNKLRLLATKLEFVTSMIEAEKKNLSRYISGMEPWKDLLVNTILKDCAELEKFEEKEKLKMPDIKPFKESFEANLEQAKHLTENYCSKACNVLRKNNTSYTLLVLWEERITSAIHEREALLKSSTKLLAQLDEDIDSLRLLRQEIGLRLNRQEKTEAA